MNVILGGGLVGLLARDILGDDWTIIPIGKSRFYSFNPPLSDNFIIRDEIVDDYMNRWSCIPMVHRIGYSYGGQLMFNPTIPLDIYLNKVYGSDVPPHMNAYMRNKTELIVYGNCIDIYKSLQDRHKIEILSNNEKFGKPIKIADHTIHTDNGTRIVYDKLVSTIPLPSLLKIMGIECHLPSKDTTYYHVRTDCLDLEGANEVLVVDQEIDFYKVVMLNKLNYIIMCFEPMEQIAKYLMNFMNRFELIAETSVKDAICLGPIPKMQELDDANIICIGRSAAWDDALDIGSCIKRLVKIASR